MPWQASDARGKTRKADSPAAQSKWAATANGVLANSGDEQLAVRTANQVLAKDKRNGAPKSSIKGTY